MNEEIKTDASDKMPDASKVPMLRRDALKRMAGFAAGLAAVGVGGMIAPVSAVADGGVPRPRTPDRDFNPSSPVGLLLRL